MARYLPTSHFFILSFAVVAVLCSTLCVAGDGASGSGGETGKVSAKLFEPKENVQVFSSGAAASPASPKPITLCKIKLPFLLFAAEDNVMVAVTETEQKDSGDCNSGDKNVGVVAKYFETKDNDDWKKNNIEATIGKWTTQLVTNNGQAKTFSTVMASVVNAEKNKIYVFIPDSTITEKWKFRLVRGTISGNEKNKKIDWETKEMPETKLVEKLKQKLNKQTSTLSLVGGSAFLMKSGKILFVVKGKSTEGDTDSTAEYFTAVFWLNEEEKPKESELLFAEKTANSRLIFEWKGEIYRALTIAPSDGSKRVMVFDESKKQFKESGSSITRLGDFLKNKKKIVTSKTGAKGSALLFTEERENETGGAGKKDAHLWMTDGTRVGYVGTILSGFKDISYGPVVHASNNLFVLHQNYNINDGETQQKNEFNITLLDGQLDTINNIMTTWENNDKKIEGLCKDAFTTTPPCLTDGPVGFLSGNKSGEEWKNEYLNVNAKLSKAKSGVVQKNVQNGFKFSGEGAGAQWPADEQWQNQPYNFINFGFTLLATVTIGSGTSGSHNSVLGVGFTGNKKNVGLWCTTSGKWGVKVGDGQMEVTPSAVVCGPDKKYYVALILNGTQVFVYVNGQKLADLKSNKIEGGDKILYFYFGANTDKEKTDVTITEVLLYNRPFTTEEVEQIKPKQNDEADGQQKRESEISKLPKPDKNTTEAETESSSSTSATQTTTEKEDKQSTSPPPPTTEDSAVRVGVVGVLCFMLFGVFSLLGR